jgi:hypothetical protein
MAGQRSHKIRRLIATAGAATPTRTPTAASSLPDDLVFEVLSRLPLKSLCRFRCASKGWDLLVSDPAFATAHRSRHSAEPFLAVSSSNGDLRLTDMDGNVVSAAKGVVGTGLVSTGMDDLVCVTGYSCGGARVINTATAEVLADCPELEADHCHDRALRLCNTIFGFGRAVPSGAYKVVRRPTLRGIHLRRRHRMEAVPVVPNLSVHQRGLPGLSQWHHVLLAAAVA